MESAVVGENSLDSLGSVTLFEDGFSVSNGPKLAFGAPVSLTDVPPWSSSAIASALAALAKKRVTKRKFRKLLSLAAFPAENAYFRGLFPHQ